MIHFLGRFRFVFWTAFLVVLPTQPKANTFEIAAFQWSSDHPVRQWIERLTNQGQPPLYEGRSLENGFKPVQNQIPGILSALPTFVAQSSPPTAPNPDPIAWLSASTTEGAVDLVLKITSGPSATSTEKDEILYKVYKLFQEKPSTLKIPFFVLTYIIDQEYAPEKPLGLIKVNVAPQLKDPLLINGCKYISKVLNSLQVLNKRQTQFTSKWNFECDFRLSGIENKSGKIQNPKNELKITRLSLPLFDKDNYRIDVISTVLDTQSVTALSKLRKKENE